MNSAQREIVAAELAHCRGVISDYLKSGDQILAITLTGVTAAFVALRISTNSLGLILLPAVMFVPGAYALRLNGLIQHLGGYRRALEEAVNADQGQELLTWESHIAPLQKKSFHAYTLYAGLAILWFTAISTAEFHLIAYSTSHFIKIGVTMVYIIASAALVLSWISAQRIFGVAYRASISLLK